MSQLQETINDIKQGFDQEMQEKQNYNSSKLQSMIDSVKDTVERIKSHNQIMDRDYVRVQPYCKDIQYGSLEDDKISAIESVYNLHETEYLPELTRWDRFVRDAVIHFSDSKGQLLNAFKLRMQSISHYQSLIASVNPSIDALQTAIQGQSDALMQLLHVHRMGPAWGATLVEIVRRKEYVKLFIQKAKEMADILSQFRLMEQKRRETFKSEIMHYIPSGLISGMDDSPPYCEVSLSNTKDTLPNIGIEDVTGFKF